jgi:hypothetical protein
MVLRAVGPCAGELTVPHAQLPDLSNIELLPAMRCPAPTLTADLKTEQIFGAMSNAVVVRFNDSNAARLVDELDEILADDRSHEFVIHYVEESRNIVYQSISRLIGGGFSFTESVELEGGRIVRQSRRREV